jgi:hypothetical protein
MLTGVGPTALANGLLPASLARKFLRKGVDKTGTAPKMAPFGWQHVSSAGFPTPTSLASAARMLCFYAGGA